MREQMANGDVGPGVRHKIEVLRNKVIEPELVLLKKHCDSHCSELLRDRSELEDGLRVAGDVPFQIGEAVSFVFGYFGTACDGNLDARNVFGFKGLLDEIIDFVGEDE